MTFDWSWSRKVRGDFPIFRDESLVYLDSAASAQKPSVVIDRLQRFYSSEYSNIHRGVYPLSEQATLMYAEVRRKVAKFLNAASEKEIVFTHGGTESFNLVAHAWGDAMLGPGDEIIVSLLEHHANFVPWQLLAKRRGCQVRYVGLNASGEFDLEDFDRQLSKRCKLVAITQLANALGYAPPLPEIIARSHALGAKVMVDGAQGICHQRTDLQELGADFYAFSAHKLYGPNGVGVLWGRPELLEQMGPFIGGGDMIRSVSVRGTTFQDPPERFEAGTPNIAGVLGFGSAIEYIEGLGRENILKAEHELIRLLDVELSSIPEISKLGPSGRHQGLICFVCDRVHPHDLSQFLCASGVAVRAGHHCAQPLLEHLGVQASTRASVGVYTVPEDIQALGEALRKTIRFFKK